MPSVKASNQNDVLLLRKRGIIVTLQACASGWPSYAHSTATGRVHCMY